MELREYQKEQLKFLRLNTGLVKGLQSPTGTGKSIVILTYIKECIENNKYKTIVLATGFNELVFQIADDARMLSLTPKVIIGAAHLIPNCYSEKTNFYPDFRFSKQPIGACSACLNNSKRRQNNKKICSKRCIMNYLNGFSDNSETNSSFISNSTDSNNIKNTDSNISSNNASNGSIINNKNNGCKFIITNHSYLLSMKDYINADLIIIDEAQCFSDFYMSNNSTSLDKNEKELLNSYCNKNCTPTSNILKMALKRGLGLNSNLVSSIAKEIKTSNLGETFTELEINNFTRKLQEIFSERAFDNYLEENNGEYIKTKFFSEYDLKSANGKKPDIIITSATLDDYTLKMFKCRNKNQLYIQREDRNRYKGSYIVSNYNDFKLGLEGTLKKCTDEYGYKNGLILCSSLDNVKWATQFIAEKFPNIHVFNNKDQFNLFNDDEKNSDKVKLIIGSKKFYQGVNIPSLDFVMMDKLPFSPYDDKFQAYSYYIEKVTKENAWTGYTLPLMFNALLQGMGRLWRKNDIEHNNYDQGLFAIFDPRLEKKFNYIEKRIVKMKPGIKLIQIGKDGEEIDQIAKEEKKKEKENATKRKRRKIQSAEITNNEIDAIIASEIISSSTIDV